MSRPELVWPAPIIPKPTGSKTDYLPHVLNAQVYKVCKETPLTLAQKLTERLGSTVYLKREDLQPIFSFKCRGAYNKIVSLKADERARGVICVSAGNHAQGVALAASKLGIKATIVMPTFAPEIKVENVRRLGGNVVLFGADFDEAKRECMRLCQEKNMIFVPPFDDPLVIAGQGTVGAEILRQLPDDLDAIFVCVGGGGLIAGIASYVKRVRPSVRIIGVNTFDSDGMYQSLLRGEPVEIKQAGLFSDGTSVRLPGKECVKLAKECVDDMVLVNNDEICAAIKDTFDDTRSILEPAGALGLAGLKKYLLQNPGLQGGVYVAVTSGANMNFDRLRFVAERANIGLNKEALLSCKIPERPGSLRELYQLIYPRAVTEIAYRFNDEQTARIFIGFETKEPTDLAETVDKINAKDGWEAYNISGNELAKTHGRFMIGGRSTNVHNEVLYRCRFPERPGAFKTFLSNIDGDWNVSLFHYRHAGADYGRCLVGLQVPEGRDDPKFQQFLHDLAGTGAVDIQDETDNPVYRHFLH